MIAPHGASYDTSQSGVESPRNQASDASRSAAIGCLDCDKLFARDLSESFAPFRERRARYADDPDYVWDVLADGARRASAIADQVMGEVKAAVGLP